MKKLEEMDVEELFKRIKKLKDANKELYDFAKDYKSISSICYSTFDIDDHISMILNNDLWFYRKDMFRK